jgi:hypothetical protein
MRSRSGCGRRGVHVGYQGRSRYARDGGDRGAERIESRQVKRIVRERSALKNLTCGGQNNCGR